MNPNSHDGNPLNDGDPCDAFLSAILEMLSTTRQIATRKKEARRAGGGHPKGNQMYNVINLNTNESHGEYETVGDARACVWYDKLDAYEIWLGDLLVQSCDERGSLD